MRAAEIEEACDSRVARCNMVDSSSSNRDRVMAKVGRGSCCCIQVTNPSYASVRPVSF